MKKLIAIVLTLTFFIGHAQSFSQKQNEKYDSFKKNAIKEYSSFREQCNREYADFLRYAWDWYEGKEPIPAPVEPNPVPPKPYVPQPHDEEREKGINNAPVVVQPIQEDKHPLPVEPIYEVPSPHDDYFTSNFYGVKCNVRLPESTKRLINNVSPDELAKGWEILSSQEMDNAVRDCLELRIRYNLSDWAYFLMLNEISGKYCDDINSATLLAAYLYSQSGYQMRLANDNGRLSILFGSRHRIYNHPYFVMDGVNFYPYGEVSEKLSICNGAMKGETPMSLLITGEQRLGSQMSESRVIRSERYPEMCVNSQVYNELIDFYNTFPTSELDGNFMTRWAMYANTPLSQKTRDILYPGLKKSIEGLSVEMAANKLLNWVQTGFVYEYDDKVWGHDRAFFAEETLYYPYCDCEDRSILYSRLVRDLLGLDVALIYYPGHLATAVCFDGEVRGDAMIINGRRFIVCDPTYMGAPIGAQMPDLEYDKAQAIVLNK